MTPSFATAAAGIARLYRLEKWPVTAEHLPAPRPAGVFDLPLPMRVEMFWRRLNHAAVVPLQLHIIRRVETPLDARVLRSALQHLARRHEPLRSVLALSDGSPVQRILPEADISLDLLDLSAIPSAEEEEAKAVIGFIQQPIDLYRGPVFRAQLIRRDGHQLVALLLHHYFGDAKAMPVLFADLMAIYAALAGRGALPPVSPSWQYGDYALWQRDFARTRLEKFLGYWAGALDLSAPAAGEDRGAGQVVDGVIGADLAAAARDFAARRRSSLFAVMLTAYQFALAKWSGQDHVTTAIPLAARTRPQFADTVGYLMNAIPVQSRIGAASDPQAVLDGFGRTLMRDYFYQDISYEILEPYLAADPLCATMFNFIPGVLQSAGAKDGAMRPFASPLYDAAMRSQKRVRVVRDFVLYLIEADGRLRLSILYNTDRFGADAIAAFMTRFEDELARLTT